MAIDDTSAQAFTSVEVVWAYTYFYTNMLGLSLPLVCSVYLSRDMRNGRRLLKRYKVAPQVSLIGLGVSFFLFLVQNFSEGLPPTKVFTSDCFFLILSYVTMVVTIVVYAAIELKITANYIEGASQERVLDTLRNTRNIMASLLPRSREV
jgi:hypothetical protein